MNIASRTITGIGLIAIGLAIAYIGLWDIHAFIYAVPVVSIGVAIFCNKKEDEIEKIKDRNSYH